MISMISPRPAPCLFAAAALLFGAPAAASDIAVALTEDTVEVDASFAGARIVLFGALTGEAAADTPAPPDFDIVAVVRGPANDFDIRPMRRQGMIWTRGPATRIESAPSILLTSATRPVDEIAPRSLRRALGLGIDSIDYAPLVKADDAIARIAAFDALIDYGRATGRYLDRSDAVEIRKGALFSIDVVLPPITPVGDYSVDVFLLRGADVIARDSATIYVGKVGLERHIYELAHERPIAYGLGAVSIAVAAGLGAAAAFRK